eukprot:Pgem_evm1s6333
MMYRTIHLILATATGSEPTYPSTLISGQIPPTYLPLDVTYYLNAPILAKLLILYKNTTFLIHKILMMIKE